MSNSKNFPKKKKASFKKFPKKEKKDVFVMNDCLYCKKGRALVVGKTDDYGIAIQRTNRLIAYGYDIHGSGSNGLDVSINYCPMCGRKLKEVE